MANLNINLNLQSLKNAFVKEFKGTTSTKKCICIPIEENDLYEGKNGVYLNLVAWANDKLKDEKTHLVKQSFSKQFRERTSQEELKNSPIIGDVKPIQGQTNQTQNAPAPAATSYAAPIVEDGDSLPF